MNYDGNTGVLECDEIALEKLAKLEGI